ncbi:MAG: Crp/Fnr family transcriptional regulator [Gammaproteobacteria bacterium]|nr:Crp/Fnr family transcriptional regulator [Gammaproteobacteria bacterium]MBU1654176.1 Crp/Fnr family transcriptional regulator [Gammaproteobacteria bacterium]MBU1961822.1 Crp/Fnr family transcriptional regulator [Gammaproteobacteria bacterium]
MVKTVPCGDAWSGAADCKSCSVRETVLFAGLREADFEKIHQPIDQFIMPAGSILYRAGSSGDRMYTIRSGMVKLVQFLPDGSQRIVRLSRDTDVIGQEALLGQPYQHDAVILHTTELCSLPIPVVKRLSDENPALHTELLKRWQRALSEADAWLTQLSTGSARQRIARLLLRLVKDSDANAKECELFSREDMGSMLGVTTETASRTIAEFRRQGLLKEVGSNRYICDLQGLEKIADE